MAAKSNWLLGLSRREARAAGERLAACQLRWTARPAPRPAVSCSARLIRSRPPT